MGIFSKLFDSNKEESPKEKTITILAPVSGKVVDISQVPDPTFAEKLLGDGVAIEPSNGSIVSPISGTITAFPNSLHAFTVKDDLGIEVLVHVGLETVSMDGEGFEAKTTAGAVVNASDPMIDVDLEAVKSAGNPTITPIVITSMHKVKGVEFLAKDTTVNSGDPIFTLTLI